jgi:hypothetical protein
MAWHGSISGRRVVEKKQRFTHVTASIPKKNHTPCAHLFVAVLGNEILQQSGVTAGHEGAVCVTREHAAIRAQHDDTIGIANELSDIK